MKIRLKIKNKSQRYDINKPTKWLYVLSNTSAGF